MLTKPGKPVGILNGLNGAPKISVSVHLPSADLAHFVEHYWVVQWDLRGQEPHLQETLPHPSVHLTFESGRSRVTGVVKGRFSIVLKERGTVFGVKFRPGAYYAILKRPVSTLTNREESFSATFGRSSLGLEQQILTQETVEQMIPYVESFLREIAPERDDKVDFIHDVIQTIISDRSMMKVEDIAAHFAIHQRQLQLLFQQYVGVSPKWTIQRYRLHDAVIKMTSGYVPDWSKLAVDLGFYDQAHFIKSFKSIIGKTPEEYASSLMS